jgi:tetratricopeptide (TPR) repeat protein
MQRPVVSAWVTFAPLGQAPQCTTLLAESEALELAKGDDALLTAVYNRVGYCQWASGALNDARQTWTRAEKLCPFGAGASERAMTQVLLQACRLAQGDFDQVLLCHERTLAAIAEAPSACWLVRALSATAFAWALRGNRAAAVALGREALLVAEAGADPDAMASAYSILAFAHTATGDAAAGREQAERALEMARAPLERIWARAALGWAVCRGPAPASATAHAVGLLAPLLAEVQTVQLFPAEISVMLLLAEGYRTSGRPSLAQALLETVISRGQPAGMRFHVAVAHRLLAEISLDADSASASLPSARAHFERSIDLLHELRADAELALAFGGYARLHQRRDDDAQATSCLGHALTILEPLGSPHQIEMLRPQIAPLDGS